MFRQSLSFYLSFVARGAAAIPHPQKAFRGGEDAYMTHAKSVGVADGVGGWASSGINPAMFARAIMEGGLSKLGEGGGKVPDAVALMQAGHQHALKARHEGSCAAITSSIVDDKFLSICNLGDCGIMILRKGTLLYRSTELQHYFNCPYQMDGSGQGDKASDGSVSKIELHDGDIVMMGSDGVFDNVEDDRIVEILRDALCTGKSGTTKQAAMLVAQEASTCSKDRTALTPFARKALEEMRKNPRKYGTNDELGIYFLKVC